MGYVSGVYWMEDEAVDLRVCSFIIFINHGTQHSKVLYRWGVRRIGKTGKHGEVGVNRKRWVLAQALYSPQGNRKHSPRVEPFNQGDRTPDPEENPWSRYRQRQRP